ncbi:SDR family NAD(P)-dependent oxidoreductase [Lysinimonas soli]|uniref:SDR family NAD(P)-dependent oxidoreductase n=1 Tax=Lysinimonas soli TaxID=1074233 RepID=A0ABW0NK23_9MICO
MSEQRVAVVTGAAQGIGAGIARELAAEGHKVIVADLNLAGAEKVAGEIGGVARALDVSDQAAVAAFAESLIADFGRVDILVNNASLVPFVPWSDLTFEEWRRIMSVNLDGMFLMTRALCDLMTKAGYGRIVNIASNTFMAGTPNFAHYVASKGGSIGFVRALAGEIGQYGVTINAVAPGLTETEGVLASPHNDGFGYVLPAQAFNRKGLPSDIAPAVAFLASEKAGWITGQTLVVDGGHTRN